MPSCPQIMVGCAADSYKCNINQPVWLEYGKDPMVDTWELVYPQCFVNGHEYNMECKPYQHHPGTIYSANTHPTWTRVTMSLPHKVRGEGITDRGPSLADSVDISMNIEPSTQ